MGRMRDPNFKTGHVCRFCGETGPRQSGGLPAGGSLVPWGTALRLIRVDPDTPPYVLQESACHSECLARVLHPDVELTFHRHWDGTPPMLDDSVDIFERRSAGAHSEHRKGKPCAMCAEEIAPANLVRIRVQSAARRHAPSMPERLIQSGRSSSRCSTSSASPCTSTAWRR